MKDIINSDWFLLIGYAIGLIGIILSIIFFKKSKIEKRPCCINRSRNLIYHSESDLKDLIITAEYKGVKVESLSYTKVAFWNAGRATINGSDISKIDPIRIEILNEQVYDYQIIYTSQKANNFNLNRLTSNNELFFSFDYIDL